MLNGIEVGKMRYDKCSPRVIVHVSLVSRLFKNSRALCPKTMSLGGGNTVSFLTPGYSSLATLTVRYIPKMNATLNVVSTRGHCNDGLYIAQGEDTKATRCLAGLNHTVETDVLESKEVGHSGCVHSLYCQYACLCC